MQQIILQPQTADELRLVKQFAKLMKIKSTVVLDTPRQKKKQKILDDLGESVKDMNAHIAGTKQFKTAHQLLDEL